MFEISHDLDVSATLLGKERKGKVKAMLADLGGFFKLFLKTGLLLTYSSLVSIEQIVSRTESRVLLQSLV